MKLTKAQAEALKEVAAINDRGKPAHADFLRANKGMLERLRAAGLIHSESPFAYAYHHVTITPAGRSALEEQP